MKTAALNEPRPNNPEPVGDLLAAELEARNWSQAELAQILGRPTQFVSEIINGKKEITRESAAQIGAALGTTAEFWLNSQDQYLLAVQEKNTSAQAKLTDVRTRALISRHAPVELLRKRGILTSTHLDDLAKEVIELFELTSLEDEPAFEAAAKRSNQQQPHTMLQTAWLACVRKKAREMLPATKYSPDGLRELAGSLTQLLRTPEGFEQLPELLAEVGVRLVYVEALPGAKIDGAATLVDEYPVIGLSGRGKRLDKVWFTLMHEISHLLLEHVDPGGFILDDLDDADVREEANEKAANREARDLSFHGRFPLVPARINGPWVEKVAADLKVAPIVVVGQLQHRGRLDWRTTLARNAPAVAHVLENWE